jgi:hypothetical protein
MPIVVIVFLEVVDINHDDGERCLDSSGSEPLAFEHFVEGATIGDCGEPIDV